MELDASAAIQIETGDDDVDETATRAWRRVAARMLSRATAGQTDGTNPLVLSLGQPHVGRWWEVTTIAVTTTTPQTQVASASFGVFSGQNIQLLPGGIPDPSACIIPAFGKNVPGAYQIGERQLPVQHGEHLYVVVFGVATVVNLVATCRGWDRDLLELVDYSRIPATSIDKIDDSK
jgi:hypothetical protein